MLRLGRQHTGLPCAGRGSFLLLGLLLFALSWTGRAVSTSVEKTDRRAALSPQTVPRIASYEITARLNEKKREVTGNATIRFKNPSRKPTDRLYFHLYLNAFAGKETLFLRNKASRSGHRNGAPGGTVVHSLSSPAFGGENLWPPDAHSPGDANDRTDIEIPLPRPLLGHEEVVFALEFTSKIPEVVERTGFERDFFLLAHWFPKLAKRESDGTWAHFPFHPHGEFYADFGDYDVSLEVPEHFVVGSAGQLSRLGSENGYARYQAKALGVHDFAWAAWPGFQEETRRFGGVEVKLLHPQHTPRVVRDTWDTLERGLRHLGDAYGEYPYPTLTVVVPPAWAMRAGGMEYPTFITTGGSEPISFLGIANVELLTIHELGHQWFQGMVATNEMEYPFLDEGITSYVENRYLEERFGDGSLVNWPWLKVSRLAGSRYISMRRPGRQPINSSAPELESFQAIGSLVYARSTLVLETLARVYGKEKLHTALAQYAERYRFRNPKPRDFYKIIGEFVGKKAQKQAQLMFDAEGWIDFSLSAIETRKEAHGYVSSITVESAGNLDLPALVRVRFRDDSSKDYAFSTGQKTETFVIDHQSPIRFAEVDPEARVLLDENLENNRKVPPGEFVLRDQQFQSALALLSWALSWMTP